jgi:hypothetical protein
MGFTSPGETAKYQGPDGQLIVGTIILPGGVPALLVPAVAVAALGTAGGQLAPGPADSGGMGFRLVRVLN